VVYTAREAGKLVCFAMYTLAYHPHHQTVRYDYCELIGVLYSERGRGIGNNLIAYAEAELPKLGVDRMIQGDRYYHGKTSIFEKRTGYTLVERFYQKVLTPEPAEGDAAASLPQPPAQSET
jgi:GNAT superfamily N-acetyltransferase